MEFFGSFDEMRKHPSIFLTIPGVSGMILQKRNFKTAQRGRKGSEAILRLRPVRFFGQGFFSFKRIIFCGGTAMECKAQLMDEAAMRRALMRIAHEITEKNRGTRDLLLVGIERRGADLAQRICDNIEMIEGVRVPCESIDIHAYRDDLDNLPPRPIPSGETRRIPVSGKKVILVDDVLYTGRTVRAAIEAVFSMGRPSAIQLAILVDRGHRELPIRADYVGKNVPTSRAESIDVRIARIDGENAVVLCGTQRLTADNPHNESYRG